jgi:hypothetical protein
MKFSCNTATGIKNAPASHVASIARAKNSSLAFVVDIGSVEIAAA